MTDNGPYETSEQVRRLPAVRAIYDAMHDSPRRGTGQDECEKLLTRACEEAGVTLGAYDARILRWLANWEPETCMVVAGLITRAAQRPEGTVTEYGVRFTLYGSVEESPVPDKAAAERAIEAMRQNHPDFEPIVMVQREAARPAGPWTEVPGEDGSND